MSPPAQVSIPEVSDSREDRVFPTLEDHKNITLVKRKFQDALERELNLTEVQCPLFVRRDVGINDGLNDREKPVSFSPPSLQTEGTECVLEIVHSLAKWKRVTLGKYGVKPGYGIVTNMKAIRQDEELTTIHSLLVDQYDWERTITIGDRNLDFLMGIVDSIYGVIRET